MIKINCFLIAEFAGVTHEGKLVIAGAFDSIRVQRIGDAPPEAMARIPITQAYVAIVSEASLSDGLAHTLRMRVVDGSGAVVVDNLTLPLNYLLNREGAPLRHNAIASISGLVLPGPDDYVFELYIDNNATPSGELTFSVVEIPGKIDG